MIHEWEGVIEGRGGDHRWRGMGVVARTGRGGDQKWRGMGFIARTIHAVGGAGRGVAEIITGGVWVP